MSENTTALTCNLHDWIRPEESFSSALPSKYGQVTSQYDNLSRNNCETNLTPTSVASLSFWPLLAKHSLKLYHVLNPLKLQSCEILFVLVKTVFVKD